MDINKRIVSLKLNIKQHRAQIQILFKEIKNLQEFSKNNSNDKNDNSNDNLNNSNDKINNLYISNDDKKPSKKNSNLNKFIQLS